MSSRGRVGLQIDPPETFNFKTDTTFLLALEAQRRGYGLCYYTPENLIWQEGRLSATGAEIHFSPEAPFFKKRSLQTFDLHALQVILIRQNPPFHMGYLTPTYLLERLSPGTCVLNPPGVLRNFPEKLLLLAFPDLMPPTLISKNREALEAFRKAHGQVVLKPLYGYGGKGIFLLSQEDPNADGILDLFLQGEEPFMVQRYLPEIREGDKRVFMLNGKIAGFFTRKPKPQSILSNLVAGAEALPTTLTLKEQEACERIGELLQEHNIWFVAVDFIGGYVTEVNMTSPTGISAFNALSGRRLEKEAWDALEVHLL
ncbi:MAG: glutathione synthase [Alphaproteobacteria bacterium]